MPLRRGLPGTCDCTEGWCEIYTYKDSQQGASPFDPKKLEITVFSTLTRQTSGATANFGFARPGGSFLTDRHFWRDGTPLHSRHSGGLCSI